MTSDNFLCPFDNLWGVPMWFWGVVVEFCDVVVACDVLI